MLHIPGEIGTLKIQKCAFHACKYKNPLMNLKEPQIARPVWPLHDVEIEMHSGRKLAYAISSEIKSWLEEWVGAGPFDPVPAADCFLCFGSFPCRTIFVRMLEIRQVTVRPQRARPPGTEPFVKTNGKTPSSPSKQPSAVVMLRQGDKSIVFRCLDPADNLIEINEINLWQPFFFKSGFLRFQEKNGASRYIPVTSISVMDLDRELVYPRDPWMEEPQ